MTSKSKRLPWQNCTIHDFTGQLPAVEVSDGTETYCASLPQGWTRDTIMDGFQAGYDRGDYEGEIDCEYTVFDVRRVPGDARQFIIFPKASA